MAATDRRSANEIGSVKVLFLGQCLQYGYENVNRSETFAELAASTLRVRFPRLSFRFDFKYLYHPSGLKAILKHRLQVSRPDITLINLPALYAATSWRVNLVYEMAPEVVDTARSFMQVVEGKIRGDNHRLQTTMLDKLFKVRQPISVDEYERHVEDAIDVVKKSSPCRLVLMGPGRFNEDSIENYQAHSPELWATVNQMVLRVGNRVGVPVINVQEALSEFGGEVFKRSNHRWSAYGHEIIAREVESVIAAQLVDFSPSLDSRHG